jgi:hypothetical protein
VDHLELASLQLEVGDVSDNVEVDGGAPGDNSGSGTCT